MSKAAEIWRAQTALDRAEEAVHYTVDAVIGGGNWDDVRFDAADESLEIFGVPRNLVLSAEEQAAFWADGFKRLWTHEHKSKTRQPGQCYYTKNAVKE